MKGKLDVYFNKALEESVFPKDLINERTKKPIGKSCELNLNKQLYSKFQRTLNSFSENLTLPEINSKTTMMLFYPTEYYFCNCSAHRMQEQALFLFGTKYTGGHAFAICSDCFLNLSLILLRYYKYDKVYHYRSKKDFISLSNVKEDCECYLCKSKESSHYKLKFNKRNFILCKSCLDDFTELILTSPTAKAMLPSLSEQYINIKAEKKNNSVLFKG